MNIAIAQLNPTIGDLPNNSQQILVAATTAAQEGARILLTPELSLCGYPPRDLLLQPGFVSVLEAALIQLAQQLPPQLAVFVGTVTPNPQAGLKGEKPLHNSIAWLEAGQIHRRLHKRLLPTYDVFDEARYFAPGDRPSPIQIDGLTLGLTICEDLWNDEEFWGRRTYATNPVVELVDQGVDLIINLSASPFCVGKQALREAMLRHTAQRFSVPVVYVNQVGGNDDLVFDGGSLAMDSNGTVIARAAAFETDTLTLDWLGNRSGAPAQRALHSDSPASLLTGVIRQGQRLAPPLTDDNHEIWRALVLGVRDYARKCGFTQAVIGLSGGIDSSLVASIAVAALGADQVLGVLMPSPYSSDHSIDDALALATNLGIATQTLPIAELMASFDQALAPLFAGTPPGIAEENIQARIRGNLLMAIANKFNRLLISTGNKSELAVGYCTLYGDMNGGLAAIADVPKTQVYALCHWLNQQAWPLPGAVIHSPQPPGAVEVIPAGVLTKPPSAELRPDQRDQDSLPPYDQLDDILARLVDQYQAADQIIAAGHDAQMVAQVVRLVVQSEFKRRQAPPGLKITDRAFGTGWRMPIAAVKSC
jgi:NAD+ synthase/NAD+ synthase (glutamine-hydrolysing)